MNYLRNKKGVAPLVVVGAFALTLVIIYLVLLLPVPSFTALRQTINYYIIIAIFILIQVAIIYGFYQLVIYLKMAVKDYKNYILKWNIQVRKLIHI
jgi:type VI protein secretion system component VasK